MDKNTLLRLLNHKEARTYGYTIGFFVLFSFFLIFAIRPNLITAFTLQKELQDLKVQNKLSEEVILQIVNYQGVLEEYRDKLPLLDQAVPSTPTVAQVVDEVRKSASDSGILIESISVERIDLKGKVESDASASNTNLDAANSDNINQDDASQDLTKKKHINTFTISVTGFARINDVSRFLDMLLNQRRLKKIDSIELTQSSNGNTSIVITVYYL